MFVDKATVEVRAGDGGNGAVSFRHEKFIDKGGPDGGDGGDGGNVVFVSSPNQNTLASFRYQKLLAAQSGKSGSKQKRHGKRGQDLEITVPVGTVVLNEEGDILADLVTSDYKHVIAKGGQGGFGNAHFVSSKRQAPKIAERGEPGEHKHLILELKMIADIGIVGLPNAGKSTLLAHISNARPEIADYPFTTLTPNLGVVDIDKNTSLLFADVPGLIEGASKGKGLGDEFLRHVERTSVLLHLIDVYSEDIAKAFVAIQGELATYKVDLTQRPQIVALNKIEGMSERALKTKLMDLRRVVPKKTKVFAVSAQSGKGVREMLFELTKLSKQKLQQAIPEEESLPIIRLQPSVDSWQVQKTDNGFMVTGEKIERFGRRTDFANSESVQRLRDIMRRTGILHELVRKGVEPGQMIIIGNDHVGELEF